MKKLISLLLAMAMLLTLTACGGPEILGTYETTIDLTDYLVESFDSGTGMAGTELSLSNYIDEFTLTITFEFMEDGTYHASLKQSAIDEAMTELKAAVLVMMDDLILKSFADIYNLYGYTITTKEDVESMTNMAWEQIYTSTLGMSAEEFIGQLLDESISDQLWDSFVLEGKYDAQKGKFYSSSSLDEDYTEDSYETYEIEGDLVTFTGGVNVEENEFLPYPFTLTKVS